jgi:flagellar biosynthesis component FlhA
MEEFVSCEICGLGMQSLFFFLFLCVRKPFALFFSLSLFFSFFACSFLTEAKKAAHAKRKICEKKKKARKAHARKKKKKKQDAKSVR